MPLPNFICVGAQKAGTSTLFDVLKQSPDVFFPKKKELHFFEKPELYKKGLNYYQSLFEEGYNHQKLIGEITPEYLFYGDVPEKIYKDLGNIKVIILLRNPAARAYSQFNFHKMYQVEQLSANFFDEIKKEKLDSNVTDYKSWCNPTYYLSKSLYYNQVKRYIDVFGQENVFVGIFEDMFNKDNLKLDDLFSFLELPSFNYNMTHSNVSVVNKNNTSFNFLSSAKKIADKIVPKSLTKGLSNSIKKQLTEKPKKIPSDELLKINQEYFINDIQLTEKLLNINLSKWYK